jgi:hypothetical protein
MSTQLQPDKEEAAALDRIEAELKGLAARPASGTTAAAAENVGDLCKTYQAIKGPLEILVKFLRKFPGYGKKAADAIEFLMRIVDTVCPVQ